MTEKPRGTRAKMLHDLNNAKRDHRMAVRWLFDAARFVKMYPEGEKWRGEDATELHVISQQAYDDAVDDVIYTREWVVEFRRRLKEYDEQ